MTIDRLRRVHPCRRSFHVLSEHTLPLAIIALEARGAAINFWSVADEAGVSSGYLYSNPDLREAIASRRKTTPPAPIRPTRSSQESRDAGNATKVAALTSEVRRLRAEIAQLRAENERLRGDLMERRRRP